MGQIASSPISKYKDLELEIQRMWHIETIVIPVVVGALGTVKKGMVENIKKISERATVGVTNGLSKMLNLGKFKPSLVISALKKSVSESRISQKYDGLGVSDLENLDLGVSDFENLDLGVWDFENLDLEISPMGRSIFYPQAYPKRDLPLPESAFTIVM